MLAREVAKTGSREEETACLFGPRNNRREITIGHVSMDSGRSFFGRGAHVLTIRYRRWGCAASGCREHWPSTKTLKGAIGPSVVARPSTFFFKSPPRPQLNRPLTRLHGQFCHRDHRSISSQYKSPAGLEGIQVAEGTIDLVKVLCISKRRVVVPQGRPTLSEANRRSAFESKNKIYSYKFAMSLKKLLRCEMSRQSRMAGQEEGQTFWKRVQPGSNQSFFFSPPAFVF